MIGSRFGRWIVIGSAPKTNHHAWWLCKCDCGKEKSVRQDTLISGVSKGCKPCSKTTHGQSNHGTRNGKPTPTYSSWSKMISRCTNPDYFESRLYLGRGITVCERWLSFEMFLQDMGERPAGKSIDRYPDMNGNYEKENCRWATAKEQGRNTRTVKLSEHKASQIRILKLTHTYEELAEKFGVSKYAISDVLTGRTWS